MIEGTCRCGAVRYTIAVDALPATHACHCHRCRRWSGGAFGQQAIVSETALTVTGPVVVYERTTEDRISTQRICRICHARIYNTDTRRPGIAVIRAGTLHQSEELECRAHVFTATKQKWFAIPDDVPSWRENPPPAEFAAIMPRPAA